MTLSKNDQALQNIEEAENEIIGAIAETMDLYGVTPSIGRLYGTMYFRNQMTLDEMQAELGLSKPSMSTGVRKLQEVNMVRQVFQRGSRKHVYQAEKDFFHTFTSFFCHMWEREINTNNPAAQQAKKLLLDVVNDDSVSSIIRQDAEAKLVQVDASVEYYEWLDRLVKSIRSGEIYEFIPKNPANKNE